MPNLLVVAKNADEYEQLMGCLDADTRQAYQSILWVEELSDVNEIIREARTDLILAGIHGGAGNKKRGNNPVLSEKQYQPPLLNSSDATKEEPERYGEEISCSAGSHAADVVREMIAYNYRNRDSAREYAEKVHLSLTYLCRVFKKETGRSIGDCINENRMNEAARLLIRSNHSIRKIAEKVGFMNFSYFSKRFRDYFQMTPRQFRKEHRDHQ